MLGARKLMWKQLGLTLCGLIVFVMLCGVNGCNDKNDAAKMAQGVVQPGGGNVQPPPNQQQPLNQPLGLNPCSEPAPGEELVYTGPLVTVTEFSVKLPYEGFEGARSFDILCTVQSSEPVNSSAIWKILALDINGEVVGTQKQHLTIPHDYLKPLDVNSFYCTAVPANLEFRLTGSEAIPVGEEVASEGGGGRPPVAGRGIL